jgi:hypothetical protein
MRGARLIQAILVTILVLSPLVAILQPTATAQATTTTSVPCNVVTDLGPPELHIINVQVTCTLQEAATTSFDLPLSYLNIVTNRYVVLCESENACPVGPLVSSDISDLGQIQVVCAQCDQPTAHTTVFLRLFSDTNTEQGTCWVPQDDPKVCIVFVNAPAFKAPEGPSGSATILLCENAFVGQDFVSICLNLTLVSDSAASSSEVTETTTTTTTTTSLGVPEFGFGAPVIGVAVLALVVLAYFLRRPSSKIV